jgi:arylsulfatase A-like enzyme
VKISFKKAIAALLAIPLSIHAADKPNIVLMLVDDMGVMDTSVPFLTDESGKPKKYPLNSFYRTPNMERLAAKGVRFSNFCAMSVCSPTRLSIMTGQNAARHRTTNWINPRTNNAGPRGPSGWNWQGLKSGDVTLAGALRDAGYRTIHVGKGHFGPEGTDGADPAKIGFEKNVGGGPFGQPGSYFGKKNFATGPGGKTNAVQGLEKYHGTDTFLTEALTIEANAHIGDAVKAGKPFYLNFAQYAVHSPFDSDPRFAGNYSESGKPKAAQAFATLIEGMDKSLGDVLDQVDKLGVAEDTLVVFLGDNGSDVPLGEAHEVACAAPLRGKKGAHYEGGMRVPFIAAWAKANPENPHQKRLPISAGAIQTQIASVQDIFPTLIQAAAAKIPQSHVVDGVALDSLFTGKADSKRPQRFLMHYPHGPHRSDYWTSLRDGDWKVVYHYFPSPASEGSHYQLFNLSADPFEQKNLATSEPKELRKMMELLIAELERHKALYPEEKRGETPPVKPVLP